MDGKQLSARGQQALNANDFGVMFEVALEVAENEDALVEQDRMARSALDAIAAVRSQATATAVSLTFARNRFGALVAVLGRSPG